MRRQHLSEFFEIRPRGRIGHAHHLSPVGAQQGMEIEIAGIVDHDRIAGFEQEATEKVDRLRSRFRQDDLIG